MGGGGSRRLVSVLVYSAVLRRHSNLLYTNYAACIKVARVMYLLHGMKQWWLRCSCHNLASLGIFEYKKVILKRDESNRACLRNVDNKFFVRNSLKNLSFWID